MVGFKELCDISTGPIQDLIQPTRMTIHKTTHIVYLYTTMWIIHMEEYITVKREIFEVENFRGYLLTIDFTN